MSPNYMARFNKTKSVMQILLDRDDRIMILNKARRGNYEC